MVFAALQNAVCFQAQGAAARMLTGSDSRAVVSWQTTCISGMFAGAPQRSLLHSLASGTSQQFHSQLQHLPCVRAVHKPTTARLHANRQHCEGLAPSILMLAPFAKVTELFGQVLAWSHATFLWWGECCSAVKVSTGTPPPYCAPAGLLQVP
jgi:hypothetical protein